MTEKRIPPIVVAITGASGAPYAVRLVEQLALAERPVSLIVSSHGWRLLGMEAGIADAAALKRRVGAARWDGAVTVFDDGDRGAATAPGPERARERVGCPCSMGTLAATNQGSSRSLIERAADVTLKERRPLLLVPRETPLGIIHLENMLRVSRAGAVVMPAAPGFYHGPSGIDDLVDFMVARILDHLGVEHRLSGRWGDAPPPRGANA